MLCPPPPFTSISLVPDSEGYNPKRNENNSCGVTQQLYEMFCNVPVLSIMVQKPAGAYLPGQWTFRLARFLLIDRSGGNYSFESGLLTAHTRDFCHDLY